MPSQSEADHTERAKALGTWLSAHAAQPVRVTDLDHPTATGHSSETLMASVAYANGTTERLVIRTAPDGHTVFPTYDLAAQAQLMQAVADAVPVPNVIAVETGEDVLGHPFLVMQFVDGQVPPDNLPYTIDGWLLDAPPESQALLQRSALQSMAALHAIDWTSLPLAGVIGTSEHDQSLMGKVEHLHRYFAWAREGLEHPLVSEALAWLSHNLPAETSPPVLCWGDARIGNMLFRDFRPAAVLDWEMAHLGPREFDIAWFVLFERFFSEFLGLDNLPGFTPAASTPRLYEEISGIALRPLHWYTVFSATYYTMIMMRVIGAYRIQGIDPGFDEVTNPASSMLTEILSQPH